MKVLAEKRRVGLARARAVSHRRYQRVLVIGLYIVLGKVCCGLSVGVAMGPRGRMIADYGSGSGRGLRFKKNGEARLKSKKIAPLNSVTKSINFWMQPGWSLEWPRKRFYPLH
jgi:hypothetical protein